MSLLPVNRGRGSRRRPLAHGDLALLEAEGFRRALCTIAHTYGECWTSNSYSRDIPKILDAMFEDGHVIPVPRVAKQPKHLSRWQITGIAREKYFGHDR